MTITNNNETRNGRGKYLCLSVTSYDPDKWWSLLAADESSPSSLLQNDATLTSRMEYPTDLIHRKIPRNKPGIINGKIWKMLAFDDYGLISGGRKCVLLNNYWMRLSMISWIIKTEVCDICRSRRLRRITQTRDFDNSWYHAKTEFNDCFIIHFSHNRSFSLSPSKQINREPFSG